MAPSPLIPRPIRRTPAREPNFTWVVKVIDMESSIGSLGATGPLDLEAARKLSRMGVTAQSYHEAYLRSQGFANLVAMPLAEAMEVLTSGRIEAL